MQCSASTSYQWVHETKKQTFNNHTHMQVIGKCFYSLTAYCFFHSACLKLKGREVQWPGRGHKLCTAGSTSQQKRMEGLDSRHWARRSSNLSASRESVCRSHWHYSLSVPYLADLDRRGLESLVISLENLWDCQPGTVVTWVRRLR